jgi:hypothetical protein
MEQRLTSKRCVSDVALTPNHPSPASSCSPAACSTREKGAGDQGGHRRGRANAGTQHSANGLTLAVQSDGRTLSHALSNCRSRIPYTRSSASSRAGGRGEGQRYLLCSDPYARFEPTGEAGVELSTTR